MKKVKELGEGRGRGDPTNVSLYSVEEAIRCTVLYACIATELTRSFTSFSCLVCANTSSQTPIPLQFAPSSRLHSSRETERQRDRETERHSPSTSNPSHPSFCGEMDR
jgi:hypothetical protein